MALRLLDATDPLSPKQLGLIDGLASRPDDGGYPERWIVVSGPVRSGKTHSAAFGFVAWAHNHFIGADFIVAARQFRLIKANVRPHFQRAARQLGLSFKWNTADSAMEIGDNKFWCVDGSNTASADKIQGITASGAFLDEGALMPEDFILAVGERCSEDGAKIVITCNPREPTHWLKEKYIDKGHAVSCRHVSFNLGDNPKLGREYVANLVATHSGTWLKRNVLGLWVAGDGLIWPIYTVCDAPAGQADRWIVSIDAADRTVTHALLAGQWGNRIHITHEWHHNAAEDGEIPVDQKVDAYLDELAAAAGGAIDYWLCDRNAFAELGVLRHKAPGPVVEASNTPGSREPSIDQTYLWLQSRTCTIGPENAHLLRSVEAFTHESQRKRQRNDRKTDHGADALRNLLYDLSINRGATIAA